LIDYRPIPKTVSIDEIVMQIKGLSLRQLPVVERALSDRLMEIVESGGR